MGDFTILFHLKKYGNNPKYKDWKKKGGTQLKTVMFSYVYYKILGTYGGPLWDTTGLNMFYFFCFITGTLLIVACTVIKKKVWFGLDPNQIKRLFGLMDFSCLNTH